MENKNYFDRMEGVNIKNLNKFNENAKWFTEIKPTERLTSSDAICIDTKGRKITVELKTRKGTIQDYINYNTVLIEPKKMSYFTDVMESGFTLGENCLYINFTDDGVIIFDFSKIKKLDVYTNHRQWNTGKRQYEFETRFGIPINDAIIYKYNDNGDLERYKRV